MLCVKCNQEMPSDDRFCEVCGVPLQVSADTAAAAATPSGEESAEPATSPADAKPAEPPCVRCGAPAAAADEDGFCNECGFRRERPREHTEVEVSPTFAGVTDQGKRHAHNEDHMAIAQSGDSALLVVCDGVSSSQNASEASKAAATVALATLESIREGPAPVRLRNAVREARRAVSALPYDSDGDGDPPSTTIVAAIIEDHVATIAWAGDSRAYWIAPTQSRQLTVDDSWLNDIVAEGKLSYEEAIKSDKAHAITKWLGADAGEPDPGVVKFEFPPEPGFLLLCTDGLWNYAETTEALTALAISSAPTSAIEKARRLVEFANSQGGRDNITAAIWERGQPDLSPVSPSREGGQPDLSPVSPTSQEGGQPDLSPVSPDPPPADARILSNWTKLFRFASFRFRTQE